MRVCKTSCFSIEGIYPALSFPQALQPYVSTLECVNVLLILGICKFLLFFLL